MLKEHLTTKGIVLKTSNLGEYDRRMVVLTSDHGKITVFARGVRRQNNKNMAACEPFSFGELKLFPGKDAYSLVEFSVDNYFDALRRDFESMCLGMYFLEVADYYTRENNDDLKMMKLLYVSLRVLEKIALGNSTIDRKLVRYIFEIRSVAANGELGIFPPSAGLTGISEYAISFIATSPEEKLFTFTVSPEVLQELEKAAIFCRKNYFNSQFKSLELLDML